MNCNVFTINEEINGDFPGRGSEPTPQNLDKLSNLVVNTSSNFGIAFDGDGDRSIFCDENGKILTGDSSALLLCNYLLEKYPNSQVVTCLNSGNIIERIVQKSNSDVVRTKVGSVEVSRRMVKDDALVGYEENGGFMFGKHNHVRDGAMTLALMLDLLSKSQISLSKNIENLPLSFTTKTKLECSLEQSKIIISEFLKEFPDSDTSDGIKIQVDSDNWVMIRSSGTEPIIRIYGESNSQQNLDSLISKFVAKTKSILS